MMTDYTRIPENTYVELKPGRENVYRLAQAGSRGWVREHRTDRLGYPMVWIEWDRNHSKHNGEDDGWTFESHWNVVENEAPTDDLDLDFESMLDLTDLLDGFDKSQSTNVCPHCKEKHDNRQTDYMDTLMEGVDEALLSDGFYLITVRHEKGENPGVSLYIPSFFSSALTEEAQEILMTQVSEVVTAAFQQMALDRINQILRKRKDESGQ